MGCQHSHLQQIDEPTKPIVRAKTKAHRVQGINQSKSPEETSDQIQENVQKIDMSKQKHTPLLEQTLRIHQLFYRFTDEQRKQLIKCMVSYQAKKDQYIFKKGEPANLFFVISKGKVAIQVQSSQNKEKSLRNSKQTKQLILEKGSSFGEVALLYTCNRSASVKAVEDCKFWCLYNSVFKKAMKDLIKDSYSLAKKYIQMIPLFRFLPNFQKDSIAYNMNQLKYKQDELIFSQGDTANSFYVIVSGSIQIKIANRPPIFLHQGQSFGQNSFMENQKRNGTAIVSSVEAICLSIGKQILKQCLGNQLYELIYHNVNKWAIKNTKLFRHSPRILLDKIVHLVQIKQYKDQQIICKKDSSTQFFVICLHGKINGKQIGALFNQENIIQGNQIAKISINIIKQQTGPVGILYLNKIQIFLGKQIQGLLLDSIFYGFHDQQLRFQRELAKIQKRQISKKKTCAILTLETLNIEKFLGKGRFGKVYLVHHKSKQQQRYAIKCLQKYGLAQMGLQQYVYRQKSILQVINFPFIVQLQRSFSDQQYIYFLMQYIQGGDFFDFIDKQGIMKDAQARFYIACYILALEYLHGKNIVYRDIKPENSVIDSKGYLRVIDFGAAKFLNEDSGNRTFTIIGSPHYMAPQIVQGKGYTFACDRWSLGVTMFQMVCGQFPYGQENDDPYQVYKSIFESQRLQFPMIYENNTGQAFIQKLLEKNASLRGKQKWCDLKRDKYFDGFNWQLLLNGEMNPPFEAPQLTDQGSITLQDQNQFPKNTNLADFLNKQKLKMKKLSTSKNVAFDQIIQN